MSQQDEFDNRINAAWKDHYAGQHHNAIEQFKALVAEAPNHIDAHWGLGLSLRKAGEFDAARQEFDQVQALVDAALAEDPAEYERFFMLNRMVKQQIEFLNQFK